MCAREEALVWPSRQTGDGCRGECLVRTTIDFESAEGFPRLQHPPVSGPESNASHDLIECIYLTSCPASSLSLAFHCVFSYIAPNSPLECSPHTIVLRIFFLSVPLHATNIRPSNTRQLSVSIATGPQRIIPLQSKLTAVRCRGRCLVLDHAHTGSPQSTESSRLHHYAAQPRTNQCIQSYLLIQQVVR